jgi:glutaminyl-peptide cyclotransferase
MGIIGRKAFPTWGSRMKARFGFMTLVGSFLLVSGVLVFRTFLFAKPPKADSGDPAARKAGDFDGERAIKYLKYICELGPRISGSEGMKAQQIILRKHFEALGAKVTLQEFDGKQPSRDQSVKMANMIVSWHPEKTKRVMICGHYDTRPIADQETNIRDWRKPFVSANDGTSTVAFLMEMGNLMKNLKTEIGVDFVFFDGEEYINDRVKDKFFLGSDYFASEYKKNRGGPKYQAAILLDLFAQIGATYAIEENSRFYAGDLVEEFWKVAAKEGVKAFINEGGPQVQDDHLALNKVGIPAIDIIDFDYDHWHRLSDTPDKCSPESMANVAKVIVAWLQQLK